MEEKIKFGLCGHLLVEIRDDYIAKFLRFFSADELSAYEKGRIDLFNELIELLEFENRKIQDEKTAIVLRLDRLIKFRDDYIAKLSGEPSAYERGKLALFSILIFILEF